VLFAITVHEAAHGYAARHFGDNTAYMMGRITLNPIKHIDPIGTILMPLMLLFRHLGRLSVRLRQAGAGAFWQPAQPQARHDLGGAGRAGRQPGAGADVGVLCIWCSGAWRDRALLPEDVPGRHLVNVVMFAFNLFPLPPLDGGRILVGLLPYQQAASWCRGSSPGASSS
jgi:hypothetical protein